MKKPSALKNILSIAKGADSGLSKGTGKDTQAKRHNKRHADGLPSDHGIKKKKKRGPMLKNKTTKSKTSKAMKDKTADVIKANLNVVNKIRRNQGKSELSDPNKK